MNVIDISSRSTGIARELSNFIARPFYIDGTRCGSMEGFLQSLKFEDQTQQKIVASLIGYEAFRIGQSGNGWKTLQILNWQGDPYCRHSDDYQDLIERAYEAQLDQNPKLAALLLSTVGYSLKHSMGKSDPRDSVLTESEYIWHLERLRWLALDRKRND